MHTSILTGQKWMDELLEGHPGRFRRAMGMSKYVFLKLVQALHVNCHFSPTKHVSREEQLASLGNREHQERFQRSADTISK
ncbi:hypothetical protein B0H10DRAFT_1819698 [Mycena sp. CBHHK59/15]|nr:hypothetical protein B0H10DRAFT_1819698 [Mycena sp. CBHHK59/15]